MPKLDSPFTDSVFFMVKSFQDVTYTTRGSRHVGGGMLPLTRELSLAALKT